MRQLTLINRRLVDTLKSQNHELSRRIEKQRGRRASLQTAPFSPQLEANPEVKKELEVAYKQIDSYREALEALRLKDVTGESAAKLRQLKDSIAHEDAIISRLEGELRTVRAMRDLQLQEIQTQERETVKASISELQAELKRLKERQQVLRRDNQAKEAEARRLHLYCAELEALVRKATSQPRKASPVSAHADEIADAEWDGLKEQLAELKAAHRKANARLEQLTAQRNREVKSCEQHELLLKERTAQLTRIRNRVHELQKLIRAQKDQAEASPEADPLPLSEERRLERETKRWTVPQGYAVERGKVLSNSVFFSDKSVLREAGRVRVCGIRAWTDDVGAVCLLQASYLSGTAVLEGGMPFEPLPVWTEKEFRLGEGDYLMAMAGRMCGGLICGVALQSKYGKKVEWNMRGEGELFELEPRANETLYCLFGAYLTPSQGKTGLCHIGCEFVPDW